ncbi:MAG: hypothetical protein ABSE64_12870 [Vulcanimicrobiaceae bacterium]
MKVVADAPPGRELLANANSALRYYTVNPSLMARRFIIVDTNAILGMISGMFSSSSQNLPNVGVETKPLPWRALGTQLEMMHSSEFEAEVDFEGNPEDFV